MSIPASRGARLAPLVEWDEDVGNVLSRTRLEDGMPLAIFRTLARHPALLRRYNAMGGCFQVDSALDPRVRELVILRVAAKLGSAYELARHVPAAGRVGLSDEAIAVATTLRGGEELSDEQALLLRMTDQLLATEDLDDLLWDALGASFGDAALIELVMLVGFYRMTALFLRTLRVPVD
jgi:4-carboxymuconolactone decarboxylase